MRRGLFLSAWILSLAALSFAQQVVVRSPNGLERLKKGDMVSIDWGCVQCSGTTELHLVRVPTSPTATMPTREGYQEIGVIKASIPVTPAQQFYSYNWRVGDYNGGTAALGGGYKILVKIVTPAKTVSDLSDSAFVIGAVPTIDYFAINDGLAVTNQRKVTLNYRITGFPSPGGFRVRCTPQPGTLGAWMPLAAGTWPAYDLPQQPGDYTVELTLRNEFGGGPPKTDTIRYEIPAPPVTTKDFTINAATLVCGGFPDMNPAWYSCRCTSYTMSTTKPAAADCSCTSTGAVIVKTTGVGLGTKVEYEFFGGRQLNPGWSFVSLNYSDIACKFDVGSAVLVMPQPGSQSILFKVRLWTESFIDGGLIPVCEFRINSLVIRGPADRPVSEAFR